MVAMWNCSLQQQETKEGNLEHSWAVGKDCLG